MTAAEKAAWRAGYQTGLAVARNACDDQAAFYKSMRSHAGSYAASHCATVISRLPLPEPFKETLWVPIPFDGRQPRLSDGIYSAIRVDECGNYEGIPLTQPTSSKETTP